MSLKPPAGSSERYDGLQRLAPVDRRAVLSLLCQRPVKNIYLLAQIERGALSRDDVAGPLVGYFQDGRLVSVAICGSNLVISDPVCDEAIAAFAQFAKVGRYLVRVVVGEDDTVTRFMDFYGRSFRPIRLERGGQHLYSVNLETLIPAAEPVALRAAELEELLQVVRIDRAMVSEELGFDPFIGDMESYREGWRRRIRERRAWVVGPLGGRLQFKLEQSAICEWGTQISGVYTAPLERRKGLGYLAMSQMCQRALLELPHVTLYVNGANTPAINLYHKLGFVRAGTVRSVWFDM